MEDKKAFRFDSWILGLTVLCLAIHFRNLFSNLFDYDSSLYAEVAREIYQRKDFLHLTQGGQPFLDKPHLFFWLSGLSYFAFGVNNFAFKFPSFIALIGTVAAVYQFCKNYYTRSVGITAAAVTASSLGVFLMTNDVRVEMVLTCCIMCGIWFFSSYLLRGRMLHLLLASASFAAAYYTKGGVGFIIPAVAIAPHVIKHYSVKDGFKLLLSLLLPVLIFLIPLFLIAYYQFGWTGVRYFAWDHVAGRVTGRVANNNPDTFFVWHTMLWIVAPWTLFLLLGLWSSIRAWMSRANIYVLPEVISVCGLILSLLVFSFSAFQQSYYVYPLIPFAAILVAGLSRSFWSQAWMRYLQIIINIILISAAALVLFYLSPASILYILVFVILTGGFVYLSRKDLIAGTIMAAIILNFALSFVLFPDILSYQSSPAAGEFISKQSGEKNVVILATGGAYQLAFYAETIPHEYFNMDEMLQSEKKFPYYTLTSQDGYDQMQKAGISMSLEKKLLNFHLTKLTPAFLNPATREGVCDKCYLVKVVHL